MGSVMAFIGLSFIFVTLKLIGNAFESGLLKKGEKKKSLDRCVRVRKKGLKLPSKTDGPI